MSHGEMLREMSGLNRACALCKKGCKKGTVENILNDEKESMIASG